MIKPDSASQQDVSTLAHKLPLLWAARTEVGHVREHNEDSYLLQPPLFVVADGIGGHEAGEVASSLAVATLAQANLNRADAQELGSCIERANLALIEAAKNGQGRLGMGTTCTAAYIENNKLAVAHVGDSRAYLLRSGILTRISHDHTFVEELVESGEITADEARVHPNRSIITRALGSDPHMYADHFELPLEEKDRILLCSDGLSSMLTDKDIEDIMISSPSPQECVDSLVDAALRAGGLDNITTIVIEITDRVIQKEITKRTVKNIMLWTISVIVALHLMVAGAAFYIMHSWYLIDEDGYVTVYQGIPSHIGPFNLNELENKTTIQTQDLPSPLAKRLQTDGIRVSSQEDIRKLLESYRQQVEESARAKAEQQPSDELLEQNTGTHPEKVDVNPDVNAYVNAETEADEHGSDRHE